MASTINAQISPFTAVVMEADDTGNLALQTANVTALSIDSSQNVTFANPGTALANLGGVTTGKAIAMAIVFGG
jgi:hypothetical protein